MAALMYILFFVFFVGIIFGVYAEQHIVMGRLSKVRTSKVKLAYTQKARYRLLEEYRLECNEGKKDFWYQYLHTTYKKGMLFVCCILGLGILGFIF